MQIENLVAAESGWKAVFKEPDGNETVSRILGWAVVSGAEEGALVGVIVDPAEPARIVPAAEAVSPGGGSFLRYRFVPPEAPRAASTPQEAAGELAKGILKRRK